MIKVKAEEQKSYKNYYDKTHKNVEFSKNELVMICFQAQKQCMSLKLLPRWEGPFRIISKIYDVTYECESLNGKKTQTVHVQRMRLFQ